MRATPNAQYNLAEPDSLPVRVAMAARAKMYALFERAFPPTPEQTVLDLGVTSDESYQCSNYFEHLYPHKGRIVAAGIDDAGFLTKLYPGLRFLQANGLALPFADGAFDVVHSAAVLEHVGSARNQRAFIAECCRVARRGVFLTTPNRWYPIEFHTVLPLLHWLPKRHFRRALAGLGYDFFAKEENLNLLTAQELRGFARGLGLGEAEVATISTFGWPSNLILLLRKP